MMAELNFLTATSGRKGDLVEKEEEEEWAMFVRRPVRHRSIIFGSPFDIWRSRSLFPFHLTCGFSPPSGARQGRILARLKRTGK